MTIGELIYALVVARVDISFAINKLSQYGANPASIHYQAVRQVFAFLNNTRTDGLTFWQKSPRNNLPLPDIPTPRSNPQDRLPTPSTTPTRLLAYSDANWGSDAAYRRSVTGIIILLSGAAVLYSTKYQKAVTLSSTEAEFVAASDTGKTAIHMRTILSNLGFSQDNPTQLLIDNAGAEFMIDAQAPTKRTRHVDSIRYFALLQWSHSGQLKAEAIPTDVNISDSLTKATGRIKFHQHADIYKGRSPPLYVPPAAELLPHVRRIHSFSVIPVTLDTFSALHHHLISSYVVHPSDYIAATEHGRVRGYNPRSTVATSEHPVLFYCKVSTVYFSTALGSPVILWTLEYVMKIQI